MTACLANLVTCALALLSPPTPCAAAPSPRTAKAQADLLEVRFPGGGVQLAGTLALPPGPGPHPAIAITHGSEAGRRQGYGIYAERFLAEGIAVLRFDKRGVGDSEGEYVESPDLRRPCADLLGAVAFLRKHPAIDARRIGVFGASQGGWVAPMAAALSDDIRFVCVQSAPGVSPLEQNLYDKANQLRAAGLAEADVARATRYRRAFWGYLVSGEAFAEAERAHHDVAGEPWFTTDRFPFPFGRREELLRHPRLLDWALHSAYEPRLTLERVRVPLLAVYGEADTIVPVEESVRVLRAAVAVSGNPGLAIEIVPGADHGIRTVGPGEARRIAPEYLELLADWAGRQAFAD